MSKPKGQTVDLLYSNNNKTKSKSKNKKSKIKENDNDSRINLDNEIIIGLTPKPPEPKKKNSKVTSNKNKKQNNKKSGKKNKQVQTNKKSAKLNNKKNIVNKQKPKKTKKIIKWTCLIVIILATIILFMMSSVFNIKEIKVINNNIISAEEIINLSTLKTDTNMFKTTNRIIKNSLKTNAYIEDVKIKRNFNGVITLDITERKPTYMLKLNNEYVYINNQGYMLEISNTPLQVPIIIGYETPTEEIKEGNRLVINDLKKLEDVIKIMNSASDKSFLDTITSIDITDETNYKLIIESENKIVQFGDIKNTNIKMLRIEEVIKQEKGKAGEIYFQNSEKIIFREKV